MSVVPSLLPREEADDIRSWSPTTNQTVSATVQGLCTAFVLPPPRARGTDDPNGRCQEKVNIDLSKAAFEAIASVGEGVVKVEWWWKPAQEDGTWDESGIQVVVAV